MPCQQRAKRRCPRCSSDVLEADRAPPADARSAPAEPAENLNRGRSKSFYLGAVHALRHAPDPDRPRPRSLGGASAVFA